MLTWLILHSSCSIQEALKRKLKARMEYAKFLQDTAKEMAKEVQTSRSGEMKQTAEDLDEFLNKVSSSCMLSMLYVASSLEQIPVNTSKFCLLVIYSNFLLG